MGPGAGLIGAENLATPEIDPRTFQPVASRYTDWAIAAPVTALYSVPLATEPGVSLNNSNTNEDIATKFEQEYVMMSSRVLHNEVSPLQISLQYAH
jgi:hypothetical protein